MTCIHGYSSLLSLHSQPKHKQKLQTKNELLCFSSSQPAKLVPLQSQRTVSPLRSTCAMADSAVLVVVGTSPAKSGDIMVFLHTSAVMLLLYWITNFIVPNILSKSLKFDEEEENQVQKSTRRD